MKLSVSNIAWNNSELESHLALLKDLGCQGVEIAPSCIWEEPVDVNGEKARSLKRLVDKYSLAIPAFHALLFTRPELHLFGDKKVYDETITYLKGLIRLAAKISVKFLIYGSPRSRRLGERPYDQCYSIAVAAFRELAKEAQAYDLCLCIEPLGRSENEFIHTAEQGQRLVNDVNSRHFGLHLDAKAMVESGEDFGTVFQKYANQLKHFHVNEPGLAPPGQSGLDHSLIGGALAQSGYSGFASIEMKRGFGDSRETIRQAVAYVRKNYFPGRG